MYWKKRFLMQHPCTVEAGVQERPGMGGSGKLLNIWTLYIKNRSFLLCKLKSVKGLLLRIRCTFNSRWYHIHYNSIYTTGQVLKINNIYTYKEGGVADIVRLTDVNIERGYLYCSLFFLSQNKIITVGQTLQNDACVIWKLMENEEFDEAMSVRRWHEVDK
jgi:hypothetical protein